MDTRNTDCSTIPVSVFACLLLITTYYLLTVEAMEQTDQPFVYVSQTRSDAAGKLDELTNQKPAFLLEPRDDYYIVKNKPTVLTCRVAQAVQVNFMCMDQWVDPKLHTTTENVDDIEVETRYLDTSIEVSKEDVERETSGGDTEFWCECHAWSSVPTPGGSQSSISSKRGIIRIAYLRKQFEREPLSTGAELKSTVQLQCLPPLGVPQPEVFWLKDGQFIDVDKEINYIMSNEGNLIISQAELSDSGNYTCGAKNIVNKRLSESALLTVYVSGGWSSWSSWSECSSTCGRGAQKRSRTCTSPQPSRGEAICQGESAQRQACAINCPVDGGWSTWSSWSVCGEDCRRHRRRLCDSPAPVNTGTYCLGSDLNTTSCTTHLCTRGRTSTDSISLYVGVPVTVISFVMVASVMILLILKRTALVSRTSEYVAKMKHSSQQHGKVQPDARRLSVGGSLYVNPTAKEKHLSLPSIPDLSGIALHTSSSVPNSHSDYLLPPPLLDHLTSTLGSSLSRDHTAARSEGGDYHSFTRQTTNEDEDIIITYANVTSSGSKVCLHNSGVTLTIPEGAVCAGRTERIYLAVLGDSADRPNLEDSQTLLSPVVVCGPASLQLGKPCIISVEHCASLRHGQWALSLHSNPSLFFGNTLSPTRTIRSQGHTSDMKSRDTSEKTNCHWQRVCTVGQEDVNTPAYVQVESERFHIVTETLTCYALFGEPTPSGRPMKRLRLAAFAPLSSSVTDYNMRVYIVEDTIDALDDVTAIERRLGCCMLDEAQLMLFQFSGASLCLTVEELGEGWGCRLQASYQEVPFWHIWRAKQRGLHCSFTLEHLDLSQQRLSCVLHVFQKGIINHRQLIHVNHNIAQQVAGSSPAKLSLNSVQMKQLQDLQQRRQQQQVLSCRQQQQQYGSGVNKHNETSMAADGQVGLATSYCPSIRSSSSVMSHKLSFRLPVHVKRQLCVLLDPPNSLFNDWRMLAQRLSVDRYINYFAARESPTDQILDLWEVMRCEDDTAVTDLLNSLRVMGRTDAAAVIERELSNPQQSLQQQRQTTADHSTNTTSASWL